MIRKIFILLIILICTLTFIGCNDMNFNNSTSKNDLITKKYSISQIETFEKQMSTRKICFSEFKRTFSAECIRETSQGYYVVLSLDNNQTAFVFFDNENQLYHIIVTEKFKTKTEFQSQISQGMSESEILLIDSNTIYMPMSSIDMTAHIVQEGVFLLQYSRELGKEPIVNSVEFVENENLLTDQNISIGNLIPFILDLDKIE